MSMSNKACYATKLKETQKEGPKFLIRNRIDDCEQLSGLHKLVIGRLVFYGNYVKETNKVEDIFPGLETVASTLGVGRQTVKLAIKAAIKLGILTSDQVFEPSGRQTSNYISMDVTAIFEILTVPKPATNKHRKLKKPVDNPVENPCISQKEGDHSDPPAKLTLIPTGGSPQAPTKTDQQIIEKKQFVKEAIIENLFKNTDQDSINEIGGELIKMNKVGEDLKTSLIDVLYHGHYRDRIKTPSFTHAARSALKLMRLGRWSRPRGLLLLEEKNNEL